MSSSKACALNVETSCKSSRIKANLQSAPTTLLGATMILKCLSVTQLLGMLQLLWSQYELCLLLLALRSCNWLYVYCMALPFPLNIMPHRQNT